MSQKMKCSAGCCAECSGEVWQRCCAGCCAECCSDCSGEKQSIPIGHKRRTYTNGKVREMAPLGRSLLQLMALSWAPQGLPSENSRKGLHCTGAALETLNALPRWAAEGSRDVVQSYWFPQSWESNTWVCVWV